MWPFRKLHNLKKPPFSLEDLFSQCSAACKKKISKSFEICLKIVLVLSADPAHVQEFVVDTARSS